MKRPYLLPALLTALVSFAFASASFGQSVPREALQYRADMIRNVRYVWGMNGPVAVMSAQVHQESAWKATAQSPFAKGLAQFTPDTADWIEDAYPHELANAEPFNPKWALRALVRYDYHLFQRQDCKSLCHCWGFTLAAYNGGNGWISRDRKLAVASGRDPVKWFGNVERHSARAKWAFDENRDYPRRILLTLQPAYLAWGPGVDCQRDAGPESNN